jgi:sulfoquinovose isomerase
MSWRAEQAANGQDAAMPNGEPLSSSESTGETAWLAAECDRLLDFAEASRDPSGGFRWLDVDGRPDLSRPIEAWITCRMTHVFALAEMLGRPGAMGFVQHGVEALHGLLRDQEYGGWYAAVGPKAKTDKQSYDHAFVILAAASATSVDAPKAASLLDEALVVVDRRFWREDDGLVVDVYDRTWSELASYRGVNANMHMTEAFLAAYAALGDGRLRDRAARILTRVVHEWAPAHDFRIPEHFDEHWQPRLDYNRDNPADPFRPYGATVGHWLEWARLALHLRAALGEAAPDWLLDHAQALFHAAALEGWSVDGADGFVYTVDWDGTPVVRDRLHWVLCEAVAAGAALEQVTGEQLYGQWQATWWAFARTYFVDQQGGSWWHQLDPSNRPTTSVWPGKPDAYHAVQATLLPRFALTVSVMQSLLDSRLDSRLDGRHEGGLDGRLDGRRNEDGGQRGPVGGR